MISLGRSRRGKPPIGLGKLVERTMEKKCQDAQWSAFFEAVKVAVSEEDAIDAAKALSESRQRRMKRYGTGAAIGALSYPAVGLAGEAAKGFVGGPRGGRVQSAFKAVRRAATAPDLAKSVTQGALGASAVQALRENVQLQDAKKTYQTFLKEHGAA